VGIDPLVLGVDTLLDSAASLGADFAPGVLGPFAVGATMSHCLLRLVPLEALVGVVRAAAYPATWGVATLVASMAEGVALVAPQRLWGIGAEEELPPHSHIQVPGEWP